KAVRRQFAERAGLRFPPGYYEDTPWTYPVLMAAGSIATLDRVCVHYRQRRRALKLGAKLRRALRAALLQAHYRVQLRLPLRADRAVFSAYWGRGHGCNPGALEAAFRVFAPQVRTAWVADPEHHDSVPPGPRRLAPGTAAYWTALARSKYLVNNVNFDRRLVKRRGQILVQTQHGTPLKRMGLDLQEYPAAARGT
ncbi:CDP-glycerol glycerophosphotransferase family protein, partial [Streptomyces sp. S9]|nr:CDP-glycerol glycerophosphotransferase family protein [Streptomyces sp. S9]